MVYLLSYCFVINLKERSPVYLPLGALHYGCGSPNKDGALFFPKNPPRDLQYRERPRGRLAPDFCSCPRGAAGVSPRPGAAWTRTPHRLRERRHWLVEPEKSFPRPSPRCDRTAFLITNGGDAAVKNAQAPAEDLNVEGLSGGERREEEEILNQWECGELSRNFIRLQVCGFRVASQEKTTNFGGVDFSVHAWR